MSRPTRDTSHASRDRLLAIMAADAAGYSRLMTLDERATVAALDAARAMFAKQIGSRGGRVVDMTGDSVLAVFDTATGAVEAALAVQRQIARAHGNTPEEHRMRFRIGIHVGDVMEKTDGTVYGDGVNIAARLEGLAEPGSLAVSQAVHDMVAKRVDAAFDDIGEQTVKNIGQPVHVYQLRTLSLRFGRFELQPHKRCLLVDGRAAVLDDSVFDVLLAMAQRPGQLVSKRALMELVWPGAEPQEKNLAAQMRTLRKVLGADVITTIPGRGYRFTAGPGAPDPADQPAGSPPDLAAGADIPVPTAPRTNLPGELPPLLGRTDDFAAVGALIEQHRLVSIVGAGGMGKTLLAQHLLDARSAHPQEVCWVELASVREPAGLPGAITAALGVQGGSGEPLAALARAVAPLKLLLALDNAEHLLAAVAQVCRTLLESAPGMRLVVTSQAPLKLAAERVYRIGPLAVPQGPLSAAQALEFGAVALFTDRAQAADARFVLTDDNAPAVIELCGALDGLALAIELAAARAPLLGVHRLASLMKDRLRLLTTSRNRDAPARQQTLRAALEWSHDLLDEREQTVFRRLAVMAGSASLALIEQVAADPASDLDQWGVIEALGVLVDRSMVAVLMSDDHEPRYRLLDSPRAYAVERLRAAGEYEVMRGRHALAMARLFDAAWTGHFSGSIGVDAWMYRLSFDLDNAREALAWSVAAADADSALVIAATLQRALPRSLYAERTELADRCEALMRPTVPLRFQARAWFECSLQWGITHKKRSYGAADRLLGLARERHARDPNPFLLYLALSRLASAAARMADAKAARAALVEMRALEDPNWPAQRLCWGAMAEAWVASAQGHPAEALAHARSWVALDRARGASASWSSAYLVGCELAAGDAAAAARSGLDLVAAWENTREEVFCTLARLNLLAAWLALNELGQARPLAQAGWPNAIRFDMQPQWADYLALLAALDGRPKAAALLVGYSDSAYIAAETVRLVNEEVGVRRAARLATEALGEVEFERLRGEGASLRDPDITALAFPANPQAVARAGNAF